MGHKLKSPRYRQANAAAILWALNVGQQALMNASNRGSDLVIELNKIDARFEVPSGHQNTERLK